MTERKTELHLFFPTTIWTAIIDNCNDININIYNFVKKIQENDPNGLKKSNFGGWHSKNFDINEGVPNKFSKSILPYINEALVDMNWDLNKQNVKITSMWSIINKKQAINERHIHGNNFISAAYYVKAPKNCGNIIFYDPRSAPSFNHPITKEPNKINATTQSIEPRDGLLVLFPSFLHHSVEPNFSNEERVVISFNINLINS